MNILKGRDEQMIDVTCVGIIVADVMIKPVKALPKRGILEPVEMISLHTGGNAMTAASNIKKMGLSSAVIGKVGCDSFGDFLVHELEKRGIDTNNVIRDTKVQTSASVLVLAEDGERSFWHCVGADGTFGIDDVDWSVIEKSDIIFVTGVFLLDKFDTYDLTEFLKKCKDMGKKTALDVCWDSKARWQKIIKPALKYVDIFMPSIDEARKIAQKEEVEGCAQEFFEWGVESLVIKLGSAGCYIKENKEKAGKIIPSCKGIKAVDTTGAGDSFCSGFLAALSKGKSFYECARFANAAGAMCVMSTGATTGIQSFEEIEKFMNQHS